jgi:hypothetical protein
MIITVSDMWVIYSSVVAIASIIVKLTPTLSDDNVLKAVVKFVAKYIALNNSISPAEQREANKK